MKKWTYKEQLYEHYKERYFKLTVCKLVRLHEAIKLKTGSYSEQIQILILLPDKWSRNYCSEYFNVFEYLVWTHMKSKQKLEYQLNLLPEKEKLSPMKHFIW